MDRLLRLFNGFKIPTYVWFDGDKTNEKKEIKDKTLELLKLFGESVESVEVIQTKVTEKYTVLEFTYEELLKDEIADYEEIVQKATETRSNRQTAKT